MDTFSTRKWFRNQYLEEAGLNENVQSKEEAFRILRNLQSKVNGSMRTSTMIGREESELMGQALDFLQADEIKAMVQREKGNN
jgi:hypothetical protein